MPHDPKLIDDADVHYGSATRPQGPLPFSIWLRRKYRWWPGSERHATLIDRTIMVLLLSPCIAWVLVSFGWIPTIFVLVEIVVVCEVVYRIASGTLLGD